MNVITKCKMDLQKPDQTLCVHAVQGDANSRCLELSLYSGIVPWMIPDGTTVAVRYCKPDRTRGYYDAMPGGESAWHIQGNKLTVSLAPQILTVPGTVHTQVEMILGTKILSTFCLKIFVEENPAAGVLVSEDYVNWLQWIKDQAKEHTQIIEMAAEAAQKAANAADTNACAADSAAKRAESAAEVSSSAAEAARAASTKAVDAAVGVAAIVAGNEAYTKRESDRKYSPSINLEGVGQVVVLPDGTEEPLQGLRIFGQTIQNGTPSPEVPAELVSVGNGGSVGVQVTGKNLLPKTAGSLTTNGVTFTVNADGSVTVNGTASAMAALRLAGAYNGEEAVFVYKGGTKYVISLSQLACGVTISMRSRQTGTWNVLAETNTGKVFSSESDGYATDIFLFVASGTTVSNVTVYPQIEISSTRTDYEPYKEPQTLAVSTPNSLSGIPVTSDGNYTDENGQQWICDEVDFARGVYVQRVKQKRVLSTLNWAYSSATKRFYAKDTDFTSGDNYRAAICICSHFKADLTGATNDLEVGLVNTVTNGYAYRYDAMNGDIAAWKDFLDNNEVYILGLLASPIETPLSAEELAAFTALHTNYPNTTIFNDAGAHMKVKYVADTKTYIDNKFAELADAIVSNT